MTDAFNTSRSEMLECLSVYASVGAICSRGSNGSEPNALTNVYLVIM